ncbi:D-aminoacylase [Nitratireductor sp. GISD-1A_MAKvit]|uniref:N-acyl-D-amino-acid deacylase family protein n=1 Tax=Nitratireductor sp. GISD-1A_MAKvit TaxID=3234198 RepID=UPI003465DD35
MTDYTCDTLLTNALLFDGLGGPPTRGGLAIRGDRIAATGDVSDWQANETIDLDGLCLAPGFIDVHTHDDLAVLNDSAMEPKVTQGVTSVIVGNCGISLAPYQNPVELVPPLGLLGTVDDYRFGSFAAYRSAVDAASVAVNVAALAGHGTLRAMTLEDTEKPASEGQIAVMRVLLEEALRAGALGLSTGLAYPVARHAPTEEVVALSRTLAEFPGALYVTHMRDERDRVEEAVGETIAIGRSAGVPVVISHHKCIGRQNYGRSVNTLAMIDKALLQQDIAMDVYPYEASSTVLLPELTRHAERILVIDSAAHPEFNGHELSDVAEKMGCDQEDAARRLAPARGIYFQMSPEDINRIMQHPRTMIGSDGIPGPQAHPRLWGTFPRVLGRYVREDGVLVLEEAIRKMTSLPAQIFGLARRGRLQEGFFADLVAFDAETVLDLADYDKPDRASVGIEHVFVNGVAVLSNGTVTSARGGRFVARGEA